MGQSAYNFKYLCVVFFRGLLAVGSPGGTETQARRPRQFIITIFPTNFNNFCLIDNDDILISALASFAIVVIRNMNKSN